MYESNGPSFNQPRALPAKLQETSRPRQPRLDRNKYKEEAARLETFNYGWKSSVKPDLLARAGFFYTLTQDKVQCAFCNGIVGNWEHNDDPLTEHCRHFPLCPFILKTDVGNIPLPQSHSLYRTQHIGGEDVCGNFSHAAKPESTEALMKDAHSQSRLGELGIQDPNPYYPPQALLSARLRSFNNPDAPWPAEHIVSSTELAESGFFYIGVEDSTRCFHCNGGLTNWEKGDDPWVEHARWFPKCSFVNLRKGEQFIQKCRLDKPPIVKEANTAAAFTENPTNPIETRINELMTSSLVTNLLDMGIKEIDIRNVLQKQLGSTGTAFSTTSELLDAIHRSNEQSSSPAPADIEESPRNVPESRMQNGVDEVRGFQQKLNGSVATINSLTLEEENRVLKEQKMCKICMDQEIEVVFLPCGHFISCTQCAPALTDCPVCRNSIKGVVRTFMS